jgi:hypothetical protein
VSSVIPKLFFATVLCGWEGSSKEEQVRRPALIICWIGNPGFGFHDLFLNAILNQGIFQRCNTICGGIISAAGNSVCPE